MPANRHELVQLRLDIIIGRRSLLEQDNCDLPVLGGHPQLLHEIFNMSDFIPGNMPICFGDPSHQNKNRRDENGLAMSSGERIDAARAVSSVPVDKAPDDISNKCPDNAEEVIA